MKTSSQQHSSQADDVSHEADRFEVRCIGCKSWFCKKCCVSKGIKLREELIPIAATFAGLIMLTFTVDPKQFNSPKEAHDYLKRKKCIAQTMRELKRRGLISGRWFCVKEFQKNTKQTHFHVLVDSKFVPIDKVRAIWARFVPQTYVRPEGDRSPAFGSVNFSAPEFRNPVHAARYATKYLIKTPEEGWPDWVLDSESVIVRYTTSHGFWNKPEKPQREEQQQAQKAPEARSTLPRCDPTCFCEVCRGELDRYPEPPGTTIGYRVATCCTRAALFRIQEAIADDGEIIEQVVFEQALPEPADYYRKLAGVNPDDNRFAIGQELLFAILHAEGRQTADTAGQRDERVVQFASKARPPTPLPDEGRKVAA